MHNYIEQSKDTHPGNIEIFRLFVSIVHFKSSHTFNYSAEIIKRNNETFFVNKSTVNNTPHFNISTITQL